MNGSNNTGSDEELFQGGYDYGHPKHPESRFPPTSDDKETKRLQQLPYAASTKHRTYNRRVRFAKEVVTEVRYVAGPASPYESPRQQELLPGQGQSGMANVVRAPLQLTPRIDHHQPQEQRPGWLGVLLDCFCPRNRTGVERLKDATHERPMQIL